MNDIFISYAHIDDESLDEEQKGWISKFHRSLSVKIAQLTGEPPKIWRDPKLRGNDVFDQAIVNEFKNSRLMISILTPRYVKSEWCRKEITNFCRNAEDQGGINVEGKSRLIKVIKTPIAAHSSDTQLPGILGSILGFEFFELDQETGRVVEFDEAFGQKAKQSYYSRIYDLATEVADVLVALDNEKDGDQESVIPAPDEDSQIVFLSSVTSDLEESRRKISRELVARGHQVIGLDPLIAASENAFSEATTKISEADCVVHLVGEKYGIVPEDAQCSIPEMQLNASAERASAEPSFRRFVWMPRSVNPTDPRQVTFLHGLMEDPNRQKGAEMLEDTLDNFRDYIVEKLRVPIPISTPAETSMPDSDGTKSVYLIYDLPDEENVAPLEDFLFDNGLEVLTPNFDGDESEIKESNIEKLKSCDSVLIYYGQCAKTWVDMKLMSVMKAPGYGRKKPFSSKLVFLAPPFDRRKMRFRSNLASVITQADEEFSAKDLEIALEELTK